MVDKPYDKVEELYKFVNKPVTERVTNFVDTSMTGHKSGSNFGVSSIKDSLFSYNLLNLHCSVNIVYYIIVIM